MKVAIMEDPSPMKIALKVLRKVLLTRVIAVAIRTFTGRIAILLHQQNLVEHQLELFAIRNVFD